MRFEPLGVDGAWLVVPEPHEDERGSFARTFCADEFAAHGLDARVAQCNASRNQAAGTLRGMHLQQGEHAEAKLVRCTRGAVHDVVVDLRPDSPTYLAWAAAELTEDNGHALFAPAGTAHGFLTLVDDAEVLYQMSVRYEPGSGTGVRWDDPAFGIDWPRPVAVISERDASWPDHPA